MGDPQGVSSCADKNTPPGQKKARVSKLNDILRAIAEIDSHYSTSPSPSLFKDRLRLQTEYDLLSTDKATYLLTKARFNVYNSGDTARKLLAHQSRQVQSSHLIPTIYSQTKMKLLQTTWEKHFQTVLQQFIQL